MAARAHQTAPHTDSFGGPTDRGTGAVAAALAVNLASAVAKVIGFVVSGSVSMLAEAVHSSADAGNQVFVLVGGARSQPSKDGGRPAGRGQGSYFWGHVLAVVLFALGALFAGTQALRAIDHADPVERADVALGLLGAAFVLQALSLRSAVVRARRAKGAATLRQFLRRAERPELPVAVLQGAGAAASLLVAIAGVATTELTGDGRWDGYAALGVAVVMGVMAVVSVGTLRRLLVGEPASARETEAIRAAIEIDPDVTRILHLRSRYLAPDELLLGVQLELQHDLTFPQVATTLARLERHVRNAVPGATHVFLQPDVHPDHREAAASYVSEHGGYLDPDDPRYAQITGRAPDPDDDIWTE